MFEIQVKCLQKNAYNKSEVITKINRFVPPHHLTFIRACIKCYKFVIAFKTRNKNSTECVNLLYLSELNERRVIKVQRGFIDKRRANVGQSNMCSDGRKKEATLSFFQAFLVGSWASFQSMKYKEKKNSKAHYD